MKIRITAFVEYSFDETDPKSDPLLDMTHAALVNVTNHLYNDLLIIDGIPSFNIVECDCKMEKLDDQGQSEEE